MNLIVLAQNLIRLRTVVNKVMNFRGHKRRGISWSA
jgi:hypothetical protein